MLDLMLPDTRAIAFIYTAKAAEYRALLTLHRHAYRLIRYHISIVHGNTISSETKERGTRALAVCVYYGDIRLQKILYLTGRYRNSDILAHYYWNYYQMSAL